MIFPESLHLTKAPSLKKLSYLTERTCGDAFTTPIKAAINKILVFFFRHSDDEQQDDVHRLLPPAGSCTQAHRTVAFRGVTASLHARHVSKIIFSACLERIGLTLLSGSNHPAEATQDAPASRPSCIRVI